MKGEGGVAGVVDSSGPDSDIPARFSSTEREGSRHQLGLSYSSNKSDIGTVDCGASNDSRHSDDRSKLASNPFYRARCARTEIIKLHPSCVCIWNSL